MLCPNHLLTLIANHHFTEPFLLAGEGCVLIFVFGASSDLARIFSSLNFEKNLQNSQVG